MSFTVSPHIAKNGASDPLTTKKQEGGGRSCPGCSNFFCPVPLVFIGGSVAPFLVWTVGEVNWLYRQAGRQAGRANKQSTYQDVYGLEHLTESILKFEHPVDVSTTGTR